MSATSSNGSNASQFFIERVPCDKWLPRKLQEYREMRADGWDLVVLLDLKDRKSVIAFGVKD